MDANERYSRRGALKAGLALVGAALFGGASRLARAAAAKEIKPSDPTAKALGYVEKAADADEKKVTRKKEILAAGGSCASCQFYTKANDKQGNCALLKGLVLGTGLCLSYAKKA